MSGGDGEDELWIETESEVSADLAARTLARPGLPAVTYASFEYLSLQSYTSVTVVGTDGPDLLGVRSCDVRADLGAGDDRLGMPPGGISLVTCPRRGRIEAGPGDDWVSTIQGDQVVYGRAGDDVLSTVGPDGTADGGEGTDRCDAAIRIACER